MFADSRVYITPTMREVDDLHEVGCDIIAMDATNRPHTGGLTIQALFAQARKQYPDQLFMADVATFEEGVAAQRMGFDLVSTTLSGYTADTAHEALPNFRLMRGAGTGVDGACDRRRRHLEPGGPAQGDGAGRIRLRGGNGHHASARNHTPLRRRAHP